MGPDELVQRILDIYHALRELKPGEIRYTIYNGPRLNGMKDGKEIVTSEGIAYVTYVDKDGTIVECNFYPDST